MCVHGALWWASIPSTVCSNLTPSIPRIGSGSTTILAMIELLWMNEWKAIHNWSQNKPCGPHLPSLYDFFMKVPLHVQPFFYVKWYLIIIHLFFAAVKHNVFIRIKCFPYMLSIKEIFPRVCWSRMNTNLMTFSQMQLKMMHNLKLSPHGLNNSEES